MSALIRWHAEERRDADGTARQVQAAWLVAEVPAAEDQPATTRYLAYLGHHPRVTEELTRECDVLYPELEIDWDAVGASMERPPFPTDTSSDDLAIDWFEIVRGQGLRPDDVDYRIGRSRRRPLRELRMLLADSASVARLERTSGSVFRYLVDFHPEYAYAVIKLRLLLENRDPELERLEADEPADGGSVSRAERLGYWRRIIAEFHDAP